MLLAALARAGSFLMSKNETDAPDRMDLTLSSLGSSEAARMVVTMVL